jgi:hypothetical protein
MPFGRNIGRGVFATAWIATVPTLAVLLSLLVAQNVTLESHSASVGQCSIRGGSTHAQTQRFDSDGLHWTAPVGAFVILTSTGRANWKVTQQPLPAIQTKGFHFNRPPPTF